MRRARRSAQPLLVHAPGTTNDSVVMLIASHAHIAFAQSAWTSHGAPLGKHVSVVGSGSGGGCLLPAPSVPGEDVSRTARFTLGQHCVPGTQLGDIARLRERPHPHVEALQVHQHADDDVVARGGGEERGVEGSLVAEMVAQQLAAVDLREQRTVMKWIDDQLAAAPALEAHGDSDRDGINLALP